MDKPHPPKPAIKLTRIIPQQHTRQLHLIPYTIITSEAKKANLIISLLKNNDKDKNKDKGKQKEEQEQDDQYDEGVLMRKVKDKPFLKRVRRNGEKIEVMVCKSNHEDRANLIALLEKENLIDTVVQLQLPAQAPVTRSQFEQWSKLWPINFIQQQISRQVPHSQQALALLASIHQDRESYPQDIYLLDQKCDKILLSISGPCLPLTIHHPIMALLKQWSASTEFQSAPNKYYYLTGLRVYTRVALCGMCSMALVHSRLWGIYGQMEDDNGKMGDIMGCGRLNHQVKMFRVEGMEKHL